MKMDVDEIYSGVMSVLNSNRIARAPPTNLDADVIKEIIRDREDGYLKFFVLWGGSKEGVYGDDADVKSLEHLIKFSEELDAQYVSPSDKWPNNRWYNRMHILFCDMHHVIANGIPYEETLEYFSSMIPLFNRTRLDDSYLLSSILDKDPEKYLGETYEYLGKAYEVPSAKIVLQNNESARALLADKAKKHSRLLLNGSRTVDSVVETYVQVELYILTKISKIFESSYPIFISFSDPKIQRPIAEAANVPMLYLWSREGHHGEVPWYSSENTR